MTLWVKQWLMSPVLSLHLATILPSRSVPGTLWRSLPAMRLHSATATLWAKANASASLSAAPV